MRPMAGPVCPSWVNHRFPSQPTVIALGPRFGCGNGWAMMAPAVVTCQMTLEASSLIQTLRLGPIVAAIGSCVPSAGGITNPVYTPALVIRPTNPLVREPNQRLPSHPGAIPENQSGLGIGNSVIAPLSVTRPILPPLASVNQRLPSGPLVMSVKNAIDSANGSRKTAV